MPLNGCVKIGFKNMFLRKELLPMLLNILRLRKPGNEKCQSFVNKQ